MWHIIAKSITQKYLMNIYFVIKIFSNLTVNLLVKKLSDITQIT